MKLYIRCTNPDLIQKERMTHQDSPRRMEDEESSVLVREVEQGEQEPHAQN